MAGSFPFPPVALLSLDPPPEPPGLPGSAPGEPAPPPPAAVIPPKLETLPLGGLLGPVPAPEPAPTTIE